MIENEYFLKYLQIFMNKTDMKTPNQIYYIPLPPFQLPPLVFRLFFDRLSNENVQYILLCSAFKKS